MENTASKISLKDWKAAKGIPVESSTASKPDVTIKPKDKDGDPPMKNDYVTHEELNNAVDKLSSKIDLMEAHMDTKFESLNSKFANIKVWFVLTAITIIGITVTLVKTIQ